MLSQVSQVRISILLCVLFCIPTPFVLRANPARCRNRRFPVVLSRSDFGGFSSPFLQVFVPIPTFVKISATLVLGIRVAQLVKQLAWRTESVPVLDVFLDIRLQLISSPAAQAKFLGKEDRFAGVFHSMRQALALLQH